MKFFEHGWKSWAGLGFSLIVGVLVGLDIITKEMGVMLASLTGGLLGAGVIHKMEKTQAAAAVIAASIKSDPSDSEG